MPALSVELFYIMIQNPTIDTKHMFFLMVNRQNIFFFSFPLISCDTKLIEKKIPSENIRPSSFSSAPNDRPRPDRRRTAHRLPDIK